MAMRPGGAARPTNSGRTARIIISGNRDRGEHKLHHESNRRLCARAPQMSLPEQMAKHRAEMPPGTRSILDARSLGSHPRLAALLRPGLAVLDVGCGTGAIPCDIAEAVAPQGRVVGVDVNIAFIEEARRRYAGVAGLSFEVRDIYALAFDRIFDLVSAARVLQWLARPLDAVRQLVAAARPGGTVVLLDYHHEQVRWVPDPPAST